MPRLSFTVCAFENPLALRTCLSSLLDQTMQDFEIIIVDNSIGSTWIDLNKDLCRMSDRIRYEWTADRTNVVPSDCRHSRCLYTATEIGAGMATGEWLCFPNQDSYYARVFAERMLKAVDATRCDCLYCDFVLGLPDRRYAFVEAACHEGRVDKTAFIVRRELFKGFLDKRTNYELADGLMIERLAKAGVSRRRVAECLVFHN
jgi:glycosyltransferase involved in cell wall biosynthesis